MKYPPFLEEILEQLVTPRITSSSPPVQNDLVTRLLSVSDSDLKGRTGQRTDCLRSLLLLQAGEIDRAHSIVQGLSGAESAYIHGMVHRVEGDYSNAKYWFRRAVAESIGISIDPVALTDAVAKTGDRTPDSGLVEGLQVEFDNVLRFLAGNQEPNNRN
jgi:hypothetical protein